MILKTFTETEEKKKLRRGNRRKEKIKKREYGKRK